MPQDAQAYQDPGTPEVQSRRRFLAHASLAIGGVVGLGVAVPCVASLIPESLLKPGSGGGTWAPLSGDELKLLEAKTDRPVKMSFSFTHQDAYLPPAGDEQFVWGIKLSPDRVTSFQKNRPDLFANPAGKVKYPAVVMNFVIFSSVCPHLGVRYSWDAEAERFICPGHGSQFSLQGARVAGPAPRGLDPLPFREADGKAEITWIQYKSQQPDRIIVAYS